MGCVIKNLMLFRKREQLWQRKKQVDIFQDFKLTLANCLMLNKFF